MVIFPDKKGVFNSYFLAWRSAYAGRAALTRFFKSFLVILLVGGARLAWAQEAGVVKALDCWVFEEKNFYKTHHIRCIRDLSHLPALDNATAPANVITYEQIHRLLHQGSIEALDRYVQENIRMLKVGDMWSIRIYSYPSPWSWDEELPQQLVRSALCPKGYTCPVFIRRD